MLTSVALRKLFPRPAFLPDKIEISLEKHVMIDSPETPTYELVSGFSLKCSINPVNHKGSCIFYGPYLELKV